MSDPVGADIHTVGDLPWDEIARRIQAGTLAVLPVGAGAKQHGWHLPMRTDAIQAEWLAAQVARHVPALIWPVIGYGHYPAFVDYTGSCSLSAPVFEAMVGEIVAGLIGYGVRGVVVVDTGISTIAPVDRAVADWAMQGRVLHLKVYDGHRARATAHERATQRHGSHADEIETSIILALAPALVDMSRAAASPADAPGPGAMQHRRPSDPNYSASGSIGDPTRARAELGRTLLTAMVEDMIETIQAWPPANFTRQG